MVNIGVLLKNEIARVSRKEIRKSVDPLRKVNATQRRDIASLKRDLAALTRQVSALTKGRGAAATSEPIERRAARMTTKGIVALRKRLGLSAEKFGLLADVSGQTIYKWEAGTRPRQAQMVVLDGLRGFTKRTALKRLDEIAEKTSKRKPQRSAR